jgi:hypothetical protein
MANHTVAVNVAFLQNFGYFVFSEMGVFGVGYGVVQVGVEGYAGFGGY